MNTSPPRRHLVWRPDLSSEWALDFAAVERAVARWQHYFVAAAAAAVAGLLRWLLASQWGTAAPFLPFLFATLVAGWYGGLGPGVLATALGAVLAYAAVPSSRVDFAASQAPQWLAVYGILGFSVSALSGLLHRTRRRLEAERTEWREAAHFQELLASLSSDYGFRATITAGGEVIVNNLTPGFTRLLGVTLGEVRDRGWPEVIHPDDLPLALDLVQRLAAGQPVAAELRQRTKDEKTVWVAINARPSRDEERDAIVVHGIVRDISSRKAAEQELVASERQMRLVTDHAPVLLAHCDRELRHRFVNRAYAARFGLAPHQIVGRSLREVMGDDDFDRVAGQFAAVLAGRNVEFDSELTLPDEGRQFLRTVCAPERDPDGKVVGLVAAILDITARKQAEESLREEDQRKDRFLATLAHELRNMLAPLRNCVHVMDVAKGDPADLARIRAMMARQVAQIGRLTDDLLDLDRIRRGEIKLHRELVPLARIVQGAVETARPLLDERGHMLTVAIPETLSLVADPLRLGQALANLLTNAAKYTDRGGQLTVHAAAMGDRVVIRVADDGIGIPRDMLTTIFDMFTQVDPERAPGGLGIGLNLVKRVVELHGGMVEAHSEGPGRGSEFVVRLPAS